MTSQRLETPIENPTLELKLVSANDVSHLDATAKMDVYAVVSIYRDNSQKKQAAKTPIDYDGGSNPTWNHTVKFSINEREANEGLLNIKVKLYSYWLEGDSDLYLGEVNVSFQELLTLNPVPTFANGSVNKMKSMIYPVKFIGETLPNSKLSLSYRFNPVPVDDLYPPAPDYSPLFGQHVYQNPDPPRSCQPLLIPPQFQTATAKLILELVIKFAKDIKDVNSFSAMDVYASVVILKDKQVKQRVNTPIAFSAYKNPKWNHAIEFFLDGKLAREKRLTLLIELMSHRQFLGDKDIGKVKLSIQELLASNPPSSLNNGDGNGMKLETHALTGPYGEKGTVSFTYRFLTEQPTVPAPLTTPQPYIIYLPASHQSYASSDMIEGTSGSGYVTIQPGANAGQSNGLVPIHMPPTYQSHGYQQNSLLEPQLQPRPQQSLHQPPPDIKLQPNNSHSYQQCSSSQPLPEQKQQPSPPQQPTHSPTHTQGARPRIKPQGGGITTVGLGVATVLGRVIGGALISEMMSDEVNIYDFEA